MIQTPEHSSFPSGHSTEAFALATIVHRLMTGKSAAHGLKNSHIAFRMAHRIAVNRTVAGVHFPVDSAAGSKLGCVLGEAGIALCSDGDKAAPYRAVFNVPKKDKGSQVFSSGQDFTLDWLRGDKMLEVARKKIQPDPVLRKTWDTVSSGYPGGGKAAQ